MRSRAIYPTFALTFILLMVLQPAAYGDWSGHRPSKDSCPFPTTCSFGYRDSLGGPVKDSTAMQFSEGSAGLAIENFAFTQASQSNGYDKYSIVVMGYANSRLAHTFSNPSYANHWDLNQCTAGPACTDMGMNTINQGKWVNLAWNFYFYGQAYNQVFICSSGYIAFVYSQTATTCPANPNPLPTRAIDSSGNILNIPDAIIAPWWTPLDVSRYAGTIGQGHVYINTNVANDPSFPQCLNCLVHTFGVDWVNMPIQGGGCSHDHCSPACLPCDSNFGITFDSTGAIYFEYGYMVGGFSLSSSGTAIGTIGLEDSSGTLATTADPTTAVNNGGFVTKGSNYPLPRECFCEANQPYAWLNDLRLRFIDQTPGDKATLNPTGITGNLYGHSIQTGATSCDVNCQAIGQFVEYGAITALCAATGGLGCVAINVGDILAKTYLASLFAGASFTPVQMNDPQGVEEGYLETPIANNGVCTCAVDASVYSVGIDWYLPHDNIPHKLAIRFGFELGPPGGGNGFSDTSHARDLAILVLNVDAGDFTISATQPSPSNIAQGLSASSTVTINAINGFAGGVSLTGSVSSTDQNRPTVSFNPAVISISQSGTASSTMTIQTTSSTPASAYSITLTATDPTGMLTHSTTKSFNVVVPDFSVTANPNSITLSPGGTTIIGVTLTSINGFSGTVTVSASPSSSAITATYYYSTTMTLPPDGTASNTLQIGADSGAALGNYVVTVTGVSASLSRSAGIAVSVVAPPPPCGCGGGSVAAGTLITLADRTQVPVQNLKAGMQLLSYDITSHQYVNTTITRFVTVVTHNQIVISTSTGKPLIVDQNPAQKLYVKMPDGTVTLMSVTDLRVDYDVFDAISQTWVPITDIHSQSSGNHLMYDIYPTAPGNYIANDYLDPLKM